MSYLDLYVLPVPVARLDDYRAMAELARTVWLDHGALAYYEVEADDAKPGTHTSFPQSVQLQDGERVIAAVVAWRDRAHRDAGNAAIFKDPRMAGMDMATMPFDGKRMFFGGFKPFVGNLAPQTTATAAIAPYLFFRGRCEEAIRYYERTIGAEVEMMMRFRENPDHPSPDAVPAELAERIMHASIRVAGTSLMLSDGMRSGPLDFDCMAVTVTVGSEAECDRLLDGLAADGVVEMPAGKTFFAQRFGGVKDKFGVSWMVMVPPA